MTATKTTRHAFTPDANRPIVCATCGMTRGSVNHSYLGSNRHITKENPMTTTDMTHGKYGHHCSTLCGAAMLRDEPEDPNCPCGGVGTRGHRDDCPANDELGYAVLGDAADVSAATEADDYVPERFRQAAYPRITRCESGWTNDRCTKRLGHKGPHSNE